MAKHRITPEVREQIINRVKNEGVSIGQAAEEHGITDSAIYKWLGRKVEGTPSVSLIRVPEGCAPPQGEQEEGAESDAPLWHQGISQARQEVEETQETGGGIPKSPHAGGAVLSPPCMGR